MKRNLQLFFLLVAPIFKLHGTIEPKLIDIQTVNPTIEVDLFLADAHNFLGEALYPIVAKAYIHNEVAYQLDELQKELITFGLGLKIKDAHHGYTENLSDESPVKSRGFQISNF